MPDNAASAQPSPSPAKEAQIHLKWAGVLRFDAGKPGRPAVRLDGNGETGPSPFDGMLASLGACASADIVLILTKRRTPPRSLEVDVVAERATSVPARMTHATLNFRIAGAGIDRANTERAIELAITKYCSVRDSLDPATPVDWTLELTE